MTLSIQHVSIARFNAGDHDIVIVLSKDTPEVPKTERDLDTRISVFKVQFTHNKNYGLTCVFHPELPQPHPTRSIKQLQPAPVPAGCGCTQAGCPFAPSARANHAS
eukprot:1127684-Amphidinium_carterae.1